MFLSSQLYGSPVRHDRSPVGPADPCLAGGPSALTKASDPSDPRHLVAWMTIRIYPLWPRPQRFEET